MLVAFIKATAPRSHVREWSWEEASGFHEHVWQTVVDHPHLMDVLEDILTRPSQLIRPLGACLGVNLERLEFLFFSFWTIILQGLAFLGEPFFSVLPISSQDHVSQCLASHPSCGNSHVVAFGCAFAQSVRFWWLLSFVQWKVKAFNNQQCKCTSVLKKLSFEEVHLEYSNYFKCIYVFWFSLSRCNSLNKPLSLPGIWCQGHIRLPKHPRCLGSIDWAKCWFPGRRPRNVTWCHDTCPHLSERFSVPFLECVGPLQVW